MFFEVSSQQPNDRKANDSRLNNSHLDNLSLVAAGGARSVLGQLVCVLPGTLHTAP